MLADALSFALLVTLAAALCVMAYGAVAQLAAAVHALLRLALRSAAGALRAMRIIISGRR